MLKVSDKLVQKLYSYDLSKTSLVVLLDFLTCADEQGKIEIYYKDIVNLVGCSEAQFYNVLSDLEELDLISRVKNTAIKKEMVITIKDNNFIDDDNIKKQYIKINTSFFCDRLYANLKAGEIRTYLYLFYRVQHQKYDGINNKNKLLYNNSYKSMSKKLRMSLRMVKIYCKGLINKNLICISEEIDSNRKRYDKITVDKEKSNAATISIYEKGKRVSSNISLMHSSWCHRIKNLCRRNNITFDKDNMNNTAILFSQYRHIAEKNGKDICHIMSNAIMVFSGSFLDARNLHAILKNLIYQDYSNTIIAY